ncbi:MULTISPECIES: DUF6492 family protein [Rheinheimera]|uniref:DUF6492 family protein n=1 Tax=Rheinheimera marina TaxID=1774958 RepID=A0ABV9JII4_9GAMM
MTIGAVLPLKVTGSYGVDDLNRAHILFSSLDRFAEPGLFSEFYVVVPANEVAIVEQAFARWAHLGIKVLSENELVPELANYPKMRGWRKQQVVKLAIANKMQAKYYLTFDADAICLKPISKANLLPEGKALLQYEFRAQHPKWWKSSARILKMNPNVGDPAVGMTVTPAMLSVDLAKKLQQEISRLHGKHWVDFLGQLHIPSSPLNWLPHRFLMLKWTEYSLYYLCARKLGLLEQYHVIVGTEQYPQRLLVHESHPYEQWEPAYSFSQNCPGLFCVVGSKTFLAPAEVWAKVGPFIRADDEISKLLAATQAVQS